MDFFDFLKSNRLIMLLVSIIINILLFLSCTFLLYKYLGYKCVCNNDELFVEKVEEKMVDEKFYVEIKGAVKKPGVYEANSTNIINDIVKLSGGFSKKAYTKNINLSRKVSNELVIYVYTESEYKKVNTKTTPVQPVCECATHDISNCINNATSEIISSDKDTTFENDENVEENNDKKLVNINSASKNELMMVSGIGESKANNIIIYRNTNGNFKSIEEIKNVSGIGDALYEKIKDSITI